MKKIKFLFFCISINIIAFELFSLSMCNIFEFCDTPNYSLTKKPNHHWIHHDKYGVWHKSNSKYNHQTSCFSANYYFNNFGAKDIDRKIKGKNRTIVIGDSFVEGYGVDNKKIFSYLLEKHSKNQIKYLNFSSSGYFGSTQLYILINDLVKKIDFDRVILFLNPASDFEDDSIEFAKLFHNKKYRPYYDLINSKIYYYNKEYQKIENEKITFKNILDNFTYSYKFLRYLNQQLNLFFKKKKIQQISNANSTGYISYYEKYPRNTFEIIKRNLFNIHALLKEYNIKLVVSTLPSKKDIIYFNNHDAKNNLDRELEDYLDIYDIKFFNVMELETLRNKLTLNNYFACNDHMNEIGHKVLAKIVIDELLLIDEKN